jgi:hypothetical protein
MNPDLEPLFPDDLSDEAAAVVSDFLWQLISAWDSRYFIQLRRYHAGKESPCNPERPWMKLPDR